MKKLYILITILLITTTAFMTSGKKDKTKNPVILESSMGMKVDKKEATKELSNEEKNAIFYAHAEEVYKNLKGKKPSSEVFFEALKVHHSLKEEGILKRDDIISIIDFSLPSTKKRLWIIDLKNQKVKENIVVSHGKNSGMNVVESFSNKENSYQSSMGAFLTAETYTGKHGLSLRLDGLEKGINDNARKRAIVMHTAAYADPKLVKIQGRLGRSLGCPAIPLNKIELIEELSGGSVLYIHGNDKTYTDNTRFKSIDSAFNALEKEMEI